VSAPGDRGTLTGLFFTAIDRFADVKPAALRFKADGRWHDISYGELLRRVSRLGLALQRLGVRRGDRVAILSENRPEWAIADFACLCIGVADVPIYPTLPAGQISYILRDSGAVAIFVSSAPQLAKILEIRDQVPSLRHLITFDRDATGPGVRPLGEIYALGEKAEAEGGGAGFRSEALRAEPDDLATIIYTSGTTGDPKGVMLTHHNIFSNCAACAGAVVIGPEDQCLSFLPLSHIFERMGGHYHSFGQGATIAYAESIDTLVVNLGEVKPTYVLAVPRVYEKVYARALENALASPVRKRVFFWAKRVGEAWIDEVMAGRRPSRFLTARYRLASRLVFGKLRARVGGRLRFFVSGGAPLARDIARFFFAAGLPIYEGYGLTETSPVITVNRPDRHRLGTVGPVLPGVEVRVAPDGEILCRGPNVMKGYFNKPEATAEALDPEGWFRTGDIGRLDPDGFLIITDRKKDLIVTAAGKNIAPQPIEGMVKKNKYVANAVMIGDQRRFPVMLVVPQFEHLEPWAKRRNLGFKDRRELIRLPEVAAKVEREVLGMLDGLARYETPKKIMLLELDFTVESGDLTPTLKVKRRVVERRYQREIDALYLEAEQEPAER
jgi:long-chain acyl-CoA synthetase